MLEGTSKALTDLCYARFNRTSDIIDMKVSREKAHDLLKQILPPNCVPSLNKNLVRHGREVCRAQNPKCADCFLNEICDFYLLLK